jgi:hypothetical protein
MRIENVGVRLRMRTFRPARRPGGTVVPPRLWSSSTLSGTRAHESPHNPKNPNWGLSQEAQRSILCAVGISKWKSWLMVVQLARRSALWTRPIDRVIVCQANVDLTHLQLQFHRIHMPGSLDSENAPIKFTVLHPRNCRMPPTETISDPLQTLNSQEGRPGQ